MHLVVTCALALCGTAVQLPNDTKTQYLAGNCTGITVMDASIDPMNCASRILSLQTATQLNFMFRARANPHAKPGVVVFVGQGADQQHIDADTVQQPISNVIFAYANGDTENLSAIGNCRYTNPYSGVPAIVSCRAKTDAGLFAGDFISDGNPPTSK